MTRCVSFISLWKKSNLWSHTSALVITQEKGQDPDLMFHYPGIQGSNSLAPVRQCAPWAFVRLWLYFLGLGREQAFFQMLQFVPNSPLACAGPSPYPILFLNLPGFHTLILSCPFPRLDSSPLEWPFWLLLRMPHSFASSSGFCACLSRGISPSLFYPFPWFNLWEGAGNSLGRLESWFFLPTQRGEEGMLIPLAGQFGYPLCLEAKDS